MEQPAAYDTPYEEDLPLSPRSVQVRDAAKQATLEVIPLIYRRPVLSAWSSC